MSDLPSVHLQPIVDRYLWQKITAFIPKTTAGPYPRTLGKINGLLIRLIDGNSIRRRYFADFNYGGHDLVYGPGNKAYPDVRFIPKGEIWLDGLIKYDGLVTTLYHELIEHSLMKKGIPYSRAHQVANLSERILSGYKTKLARAPLKFRAVDTKRG